MKDTRIPIVFFIPIAIIVLLIGLFLGHSGWDITEIDGGIFKLSPPTAAFTDQAPIMTSQPPLDTQLVEATRPSANVTVKATSEQLPALAYGRLLYEETFERDTETWAIWDGSRIHDGELVIVPDAGAHPHSDEQYSEFIFEVEFRPKDQAPNPEFTIFVHFQVPQCTIPQCGIVTSVKAVQKVITVRKHTETETVRIISDVPARQLDPNRWNKVTIVAKGEEYQIFVNDTYVDSFTDSTYTRGKFLLWAEGGGGGRGPIAVNAVRVYAVP